MRFISFPSRVEPQQAALRAAAPLVLAAGAVLLASLGLSGCGSRVSLSEPTPASPPGAAKPAGGAAGTQGSAPASATSAAPAAPSKNWAEYKLRAARQVANANRDVMYDGPIPDPLRSIPVLEIKLNRDGSIQSLVVLRTPKYSPETLQMAMKAIRRAAPFESVAQMPQPWQFSETFLYNDDLKFQLRTLAEAD